MRELILHWLGLDVAVRRGRGGVEPSIITEAQLEDLRRDTQDLTGAVTGLTGKLEETVTRDEVADEIDARLKALEAGHASILQGTKNQIRRTRRAGWIVMSFLLLFTSFATIQIHDFHINECMFDPGAGPTKTYVCHAVFPFTKHENISLLHEGLDKVAGIERPQNRAAWGDHGDVVVPPQALGLVLYTLLFGGVGFGIARYRTRLHEENSIEAADVSDSDLNAYAAAQGEGESAQHQPPSKETA